MGWSGSLTASSAIGAAITFTPDTTTMGGYTVSSFTAPKRGIYRFQLKGSGGATGDSSRTGRAEGGEGGLTTGYLLLESGAKVYVGAGGPCSAAFVSSSTGTALSAVTQANLYFVAGAGGQGGASGGKYQKVSVGGAGGGTTGADGATITSGTNSYAGGRGGTQSSGGSGGALPSSDSLGGAGNKGAYGVGGGGAYYNNDGISANSGRGGDGYYGGGSGGAAAHGETGYALGGGGGSGYVKTASLSVAGKTYASATQQGGGAAAGARGSVIVTYYALAELPVRFNGTQLTKLIFNGTEVKSLIYNGQTIFARRWAACLRYLADRFGFRAGTPA